MSEKTEQPTPKKLRDARKKGQVAKSKEIPSAVIIIYTFLLTWAMFDTIVEKMIEMITIPTLYYDRPFKEGLDATVHGVLNTLVFLSMPYVFGAAFVGVLANFFQVGFLFSMESIKPELKKLNPVEGVKKIFSMNNLVELIKSILKIAFLSTLLYLVIRDAIDPLFKIPTLGMEGVRMMLGAILYQVFIYTAAAFVIVAAFDFAWQQHSHTKKLKMTKDEVKREYKESEGDPLIKGKRKQLHQELVNDDTVQKTKKASVLVTNPTHIAVALFYDEEKTKLPTVVAKGTDHVAKAMMRVAEEAGVPIMRNVPLARSLHEQAIPDHYIPRDLLEPVAEVLRWVRELEEENSPGY
ncbi:type III secretion system export apparatus subunit SctU [Acanthopleuribacter pedis]|uniref:Type III secretion system export apparatus subunit SctU n=1 Tax=Acanthopleuribacter pedis TaxID=442870 RepID=A0A8J7QDL6_9BACT|nr:type III secretion system export apparatus subunit SctU [Acanthopleuribacter pedis]MBO1322602.1 type III secretion system export apparatus subunit SctU [Acanthopleuribacter pedis]